MDTLKILKINYFSADLAKEQNNLKKKFLVKFKNKIESLPVILPTTAFKILSSLLSKFIQLRKI